MRFVKISHVCLRGLIQLRNDLVHYISANKLPSEMKNQEKLCSKCAHLTVCSLLIDASSEDDRIDLYERSLRHLSARDKDFFHRWYAMLELEFGGGEYKQFEAGELVWWMSRRDLEATGFVVLDLRIDLTCDGVTGQFESNADDGLSINKFFRYDFVKVNGRFFALNSENMNSKVKH